MNAIKPSWTRSPQPFAIKLKRSTAHKRAFGAFVTTIFTLLLFSPLSTAAILLCLALLAGAAWAEWCTLDNTQRQVLCYSPLGTWSVYEGFDSFHGQLGRHSYRSRWLSVVAIERNDSNTRYVPVFYDSVDKRSYSLLQVHLKFPT